MQNEKRLKILVSNDDGIMASGIRELSNALSLFNDVYIIAPDRERYAAGHSLRLHSPLRVDEVEPKYGSKRTWVTTGTPGDCIKIGLNAILSKEEEPDFIISGINHGPNLGSDILYSGTVSAAMEGAMLSVPSIAVSLSCLVCKENDFKFAAKFMAKFLPRIKAINFPQKSILNINIPSLGEEDIAGVAITHLGTKTFSDKYEKRVDPRGKIYYWLAGELIGENEIEGSDIHAIRQNKVTKTPITLETTNHEIKPEHEKAFCDNGNCDWF